jgi:hypothetical protein
MQNKNPDLAAKSRFNMGNSYFRKAEKVRETDLQKALTDYEQSAQHYQVPALIWKGPARRPTRF